MHGARRLQETRAVDFMAFFLGGDGCTDTADDGFIIRAPAQKCPQVHFLNREEAITQLAIRGQP